MSKKKSKQKNNIEDVDLIVLFNYFGKKLALLFSFFQGFFKRIFSTVIYVLKTLFKNWKIVFGLLVITFGLGYYQEKTAKPVYTSSMLIEPYFDSKYQLVTNISYFNALIDNSDYNALTNIFKIDEEDIKQVLSFEIELGPEAENSKLVQYQNFKSQLDSLQFKDLSYDDFLSNRGIYTGENFLITATSYSKDVFHKLEPGLYKSFINDYSKKIMKRDSLMISIQKRNLVEKLQQIDSLKTIYIDVIKEESKKTQTAVPIGDVAFSAKPQETKEFDLLNKELTFRDELKQLEERLVKKDDYFDVITSFQKVGNRFTSWEQKYSLIYPVLGFLLLCFGFLIKKLIEFTLKYEE